MNQYIQNNGILYNLDKVSKIAIVTIGDNYGIALYADGPTSKVYEVLQGTFASFMEANDAFTTITANITESKPVIFYDDIHEETLKQYKHE